ncbi:MAG: T9SS type A sorting domain-containing protein [Bacteroidales bacterium]|nr:T9SS type A sorting domain-containing protein [Bacteroidales bacterium]
MKNTLFSILLTAACFLCFTTLQAQKDLKPYTFTHNNISYDVDKQILPAVDEEELYKEDALNYKNGTPMRVGIVRNVSYTFDNCGRTDILEDGSKLWRLTIKSEDAHMLNIFFSTFNIPVGATFHIYSGDRSQLTGSYTNEDVQANGVLAADDIIGDEATLEYYEPADVPFHGVIEVDRISHIYRDIFHVSETDNEKGHWGDAEGDCHINVVCPEAFPWHDQASSVVFIMITGTTGTYYCSGAMINNVRQDRTPYCLTANHCLDGTSSTFKFYFFYQTGTCAGAGGYFNRYCNGGEIKARANLSSSSDFMLLLLTGTLGQVYRDSIVFAGWDATGAASAGVGIHHPGGDTKKISFVKSVTGSSTAKYWTAHWYTNPNRGVTEEGSSGSPLFNANGLIIGDLSNGSSACDYVYGTDNYGKISYSWLNGGTYSNAAKLQPWLDPDNTGTLKLQGMNYNGTPAGINNFQDEVHTFGVQPNPSNGQVTITGSFAEDNGTCLIYNAMGMLVGSYEVDLAAPCQLNLSHLPNGVYMMNITSGNQTYRSKMVITQ